MKKILFLFPLAAIVLFSCEKEIDFINAGGSGGEGSTSGNTLVKTVSKTGTDSIVTIYTYNAAKKLVNEKMTGMSGTFNAANEVRYYRNASGVLTHFVQINPNLVMAGIDSVTTYVHYNTSTSRYTSTVAELSLFGFSVLDSTALVYDAGGKVIRTDLYQSLPLITPGYELSAKTQYTHAANGNITQLDLSTHDPATGTDDPVSTIKYIFDTKTSALNAAAMFSTLNEVFAIGHGDWISVNNATKIEIIDIATPANNQSSTVTYTYNSSNRPVAGVNTRSPGGIIDNLSFYYQ
jgi:hypothetical protein